MYPHHEPYFNTSIYGTCVLNGTEGNAEQLLTNGANILDSAPNAVSLDTNASPAGIHTACCHNNNPFPNYATAYNLHHHPTNTGPQAPPYTGPPDTAHNIATRNSIVDDGPSRGASASNDVKEHNRCENSVLSLSSDEEPAADKGPEDVETLKRQVEHLNVAQRRLDRLYMDNIRKIQKYEHRFEARIDAAEKQMFDQMRLMAGWTRKLHAEVKEFHDELKAVTQPKQEKTSGAWADGAVDSNTLKSS